MKMSNETTLLEKLESLADIYGASPEEYLDSLLASAEEERGKQLEGLPDNLLNELKYASEARKAAREKGKRDAQESEIDRQVSCFREAFPEVDPQEIPDEVWSSAADGETLAGAYALWYVKQLASAKEAEKANTDAASRAASPAGKGETEPEYTREMVEKMSEKDILRNFNGILNSIKKWKI